MISREDKADVKRVMGAKMANRVEKATVDYVALAKHAQSRGYKRNLSSREIQGLKRNFSSSDARSKAIHAKTEAGAEKSLERRLKERSQGVRMTRKFLG